MLERVRSGIGPHIALDLTMNSPGSKLIERYILG